MAFMLLSEERFDAAKQELLAIVKLIKNKDDKDLLAQVYLNLAAAAYELDDFDAAIRYNSMVLQICQKSKGDSLSLIAHAYFNLSTIYIRKWDESAAEYSENALLLYEYYPFSQKSDKVNAKMAYLITNLWFKNLFNADETLALWKDIKAFSIQDLSAWHVSNFIVAIYPIISKIEPLNRVIMGELEKWAPATFFREFLVI